MDPKELERQITEARDLRGDEHRIVAALAVIARLLNELVLASGRRTAATDAGTREVVTDATRELRAGTLREAGRAFTCPMCDAPVASTITTGQFMGDEGRQFRLTPCGHLASERLIAQVRDAVPFRGGTP
jgi:hypothetical protein